MSEQTSRHDDPQQRGALERLEDLGRVLRVTGRMLSDEVTQALAQGYHAPDVARALSVDPDTVDELLGELSDVLRKWTT